jgi:23S rRNA (pseudouridine1915-N3)-methyltransferase
MIKIKIISVGKTKEAWLEAAFSEYIKRLKGQVAIECIWTKTDQQLIEKALEEPSRLTLDPAGKLLTSEQFAKQLQIKLEGCGARLAFVIGGPEGLPNALRSGELVSLSPLTMTHQIVRLVLIEQIYRAFEIFKGSQYHK